MSDPSKTFPIRDCVCPTCGSVVVVPHTRLRVRRLMAMMTQRQIARQVGLTSPAFISDVERGRKHAPAYLVAHYNSLPIRTREPLIEMEHG